MARWNLFHAVSNRLLLDVQVEISEVLVVGHWNGEMHVEGVSSSLFSGAKQKSSLVVAAIPGS